MELKIEDLGLEEKIGQMIIVGIDGSKITERTRKLILKYKIGGIILYRKNFKSYEEMVNCGSLNKYKINMSVKRIINIKEKYGIKDSIDYDGKIDIEEINKRINEIRKICLN